MSKKKTKKDSTTSGNNAKQIDLQIDYDKLAVALIKANKEVEKETERENQRKREQAIKDRTRILKEKNFSNEPNWLVRQIKTTANRIAVAFRVLFIKKENLKYFTAVNGLIKMATSALFMLFKVVLYAMSMIFGALVLVEPHYGLYIPLCALSLFFAQLFRIAQYEVEEMSDKDYVLSLFVSLISFLTLLITVFSIMR